MSEALARDMERMGIRDGMVLRAMAEIPRRIFVPAELRDRADGDHPLPIGHGQTISQPFMVAWMSEALRLTGTERVLEVGTGSGYQAAILARLCARVFSIELIDALASAARARLEALGIRNVEVRVGDGAMGWADEAPFEGIVVTAAAPEVPRALVAQLTVGGRLVIPVGAEHDVQTLHVLEKGPGGQVEDRALFAVRFVPLRSAVAGDALDSGR